MKLVLLSDSWEEIWDQTLHPCFLFFSSIVYIKSMNRSVLPSWHPAHVEMCLSIKGAVCEFVELFMHNCFAQSVRVLRIAHYLKCLLLGLSYLEEYPVAIVLADVAIVIWFMILGGMRVFVWLFSWKHIEVIVMRFLLGSVPTKMFSWVWVWFVDRTSLQHHNT